MLTETTRFLAAAAIRYVRRQFLEGHPDPTHVDRRLTEYDEAIAELDALYAAPQGAAVPVPDWANAPSWANFWAVDANGWASWYRVQPYCDDDEGACWCPQFVDWDDTRMAPSTSRIDEPKFDKKVAMPLGCDWRLTLQPRPAVTGDGT